MEKRTKRVRGSNWNHAHTMALAELKREASLNKEDGRLVWERIAQTLSGRFPGQIRTGDQCRRRWDTLVKVYNHIEDYCVVTGAQNHRELDEGELASMKLGTAYQQDWYDIVEQVCSQRRSKERCDRDLMLAKRSTGSHSGDLPEHPPNRDTLCPASTSKSVTYREQSTPESTTTYAQVPSSPCLEVDKLNPEEEVLRLKNGSDGLTLEVTQLRLHGHVSHGVSQEPQKMESANMLPHTFPAENGAQLNEPLQLDLWALLDDPPFETSTEIEQFGSESELTDPSLWGWENVLRIDVVKEEEYYPSTSYQVANVARATKASRASKASRAAIASRESKFSGLKFFSQPALLSSATMTSSTSSRSADSTISTQSRPKVIDLIVHQCCHSCGCKVKAEDLEMETKQAARLKEKARKKALMSRKESVSAMLNAASSTSATCATRGDKPLQKDSQRTAKQAALVKKEEETMTLKAERQQLGGKSSSKCVAVDELCAKLSMKLL